MDSLGRAFEIFDELVDAEPSARADRLEELCGGDGELRKQVERLLAAEAQTSGESIGDVIRGVLGAERSSRRMVGERIGPYTILKCLGEGGFGVVYLAEQHKPVRRRVALKLIKPELLRREDAKSVTARFELERETLKLLAHEHIARIYDAGATEGGVPYFAMEYVPGDPITKFCDEHKLDIEARLDLFMKVCEAVQHAHNNGIIHRDLSPSNILVAMVDGEPQPKVIDFGVAKAVNPEMMGIYTGTITGQVIGKLEYMSPEQAKNPRSGVDIRSDVYALGVLLYEVLTGMRPFDLREEALHRVVEVIDRVDPPTPSSRLATLGADNAERLQEIARDRQLNGASLERTLRRELEWIPLMAMRKEPSRRYRTAGDLADDLRAYRKGEALRAGPESKWYRLRKVVRQHKGAVIAVGTIFALLTGGVFSTSLLLGRAIDAEQEQTRLAQSESRARAASEAAALVAMEQALKAKQGMILATAQSVVSQDPTLAALLLRDLPEQSTVIPDHLLMQVLHGKVIAHRIMSRSQSVQHAAWSPDGSRIVTASFDGTARIWNIDEASKPHTLRGHGDSVNHAAWSPDGSQIVTASDDATARVWSADDLDEIAVLRGHNDKVQHAAWSPDGSHIVTASDDGTARVWSTDAWDKPVILRGHMGLIRYAAWSPDGSQIVTASDDGTARVWNAGSWDKSVVLRGHTGLIRYAAWSPDGSHIVTASDDRTARVWSAGAWDKPIVLRGHSGLIRYAEWNPDGTLIVTASDDGTARVWQADGKGESIVLDGHMGSVNQAAWSPDGSRLLTVSDDGSTRVWSADGTHELVVLRGPRGRSRLAAWSPDGLRIVTASWDETTRIWDIDGAEDPTVLRAPLGGAKHVAWSPDGSQIATTSWATILVWNTHRAGNPTMLSGHLSAVEHIAWSPDGTQLVTTSWDKTAGIWSADGTGEPVVLQGHQSTVNSAVWGPDGSQIVTASNDRTARVWSAGAWDKPIVLRGHSGLIRYAEWNPDGTLIVTASDDGTARVWNANGTGEPIVLREHTRAWFDTQHGAPMACTSSRHPTTQLPASGAAMHGMSPLSCVDMRTRFAMPNGARTDPRLSQHQMMAPPASGA